MEGGSRLRSQGNGEAGFRGGPAGDLYVVLFVKHHEIFKRDGDDLICEVPVSFVQAALGSEIEVPDARGGRGDDQEFPAARNRARLSASKARA